MPLTFAVIVSNSENIDGDNGLYAMETDGTIEATTPTPDSSPGYMARRASDAHTFAFNGDTTVDEYDADLTFVQTFGNTSASNPASLVPQSPTNLNWQRFMIQFVGSSVFLGWTGFDTNTHVAVQERNATTFALLGTTLDFDGGLPAGGRQPLAMSPDGNIIYFIDVGSGVADQNFIYAYDIGMASNSQFASYGTWTSPTGWYTVGIRTKSNGDVIGLFNHVNGDSLTDEAHVVVWDDEANELSSFSVFVSEVDDDFFPTNVFNLSFDETSIWTTGPVGAAPDYFDAYRRYRLSDGDLLTTALPETYLLGGSGSDFVAYHPTALPPDPVTTTYPTVRERIFALPFETNLMLFLERIEFLIQAGEGLVTGQGSNPVVAVWFSKDGGKTYGNGYTVRPGKMGEYTKRSYLNRIGRARNWVCKIRVSDPVFWAFLDCYVDMSVGQS